MCLAVCFNLSASFDRKQVIYILNQFSINGALTVLCWPVATQAEVCDGMQLPETATKHSLV